MAIDTNTRQELHEVVDALDEEDTREALAYVRELIAKRKRAIVDMVEEGGPVYPAGRSPKSPTAHAQP